MLLGWAAVGRDFPSPGEVKERLSLLGWAAVGRDFPSPGEVKERLSLLGWAAVCWAGLSLTR